MTGKVIQFPEAPQETANLRCACGGEWWTTSGIVLAADGSLRVTGYVADNECVSCGAPLPLGKN